jgi:hypothetical protein
MAHGFKAFQIALPGLSPLQSSAVAQSIAHWHVAAFDRFGRLATCSMEPACQQPASKRNGLDHRGRQKYGALVPRLSAVPSTAAPSLGWVLPPDHAREISAVAGDRPSDADSVKEARSANYHVVVICFRPVPALNLSMPRFQRNVEALQLVIPTAIPPGQIEVRLGAIGCLNVVPCAGVALTSTLG